MQRRQVTPLKIAIVTSGRRQKDIAAELDIDESHFSRIVNGLHVDDETRNRIADALGRHADELGPQAQAA